MVIARMLYDHRTDPDENINISEIPEYLELTRQLHERIMDQVRLRETVIMK